ncbi:DUF6508 domain-containing protein [Evansella clarkii]|uniref:DUF6508 domain-containing protein n=1 Tax=Evansella clarkii TaxID=79879 RepID=UPI000B444E7F|nr:DUF6508 domain-containing protein [Evansella clarkii]
MKNIKEVISYLKYFEDEYRTFYHWDPHERSSEGNIKLSYPKYDDRLNCFINAIYKSGLLMDDYAAHYKGGFTGLTPEKISAADIKELRGMLTFIIRAERFSEGSWAHAAKDKLFYYILKRLNELYKKKK